MRKIRDDIRLQAFLQRLRKDLIGDSSGVTDGKYKPEERYVPGPEWEATRTKILLNLPIFIYIAKIRPERRNRFSGQICQYAVISRSRNVHRSRPA